MSLLPKTCPRSKNIDSPMQTLAFKKIIQGKFDRIAHLGELLVLNKFDKMIHNQTKLPYSMENVFLRRLRDKKKEFLARKDEMKNCIKNFIDGTNFEMVKIVEFEESEKIFRAYEPKKLGEEGDLRRGFPRNTPLELNKVYFGISPDIPVHFALELNHPSIGEYIVKKNFSCLDIRVSENDLNFISWLPQKLQHGDRVGQVLFLQEIKVLKTLLLLNGKEEYMVTLIAKLLEYEKTFKNNWTKIGKFTTISMISLINTINAYLRSQKVIGIIRQNVDTIEKHKAFPSKVTTKAHEDLSIVESTPYDNCYPELIIRSDFLTDFINPIPKKIIKSDIAKSHYGVNTEPYSTASHLSREPYEVIEDPASIPSDKGKGPGAYAKFYNKMVNYSSVFNKTFFKK